jgi:hypothetical protein
MDSPSLTPLFFPKIMKGSLSTSEGVRSGIGFDGKFSGAAWGSPVESGARRFILVAAAALALGHRTGRRVSL